MNARWRGGRLPAKIKMEWHGPVRAKDGMGLVDALAAVAVLCLLATSVMPRLSHGVAWTRSAGDRTRALMYAADVMEAVKAARHRLAVVGPGTYTSQRGNWADLQVTVAGEREDLRAEVTVESVNGTQGVRVVTVQVRETTGGDQPLVRLATAMATEVHEAPNR
ncbi:MAG: hypothetical protein QHH05_05620 [Syntrophomonadaceae bacterium]|nr:hypothetical protein [Syntrophomonadaceae bacterium]